jgi:hypothetical protein
MKLLTTLLIGCAFASRIFALEPSAVIAVAGKFETKSPGEQYSARMELYQLINDATAPGEDDPVAVTKVLVSVMQDPAVSDEAKKYILRAMAFISTVDAVDMLAKLINGSDALFRDEARQVLESIHDPESVAVLEAALTKASDKREKIALADSLAMQEATSSVALLALLTVDSDPEISGAGIRALAKIGGPDAVETLKKANASSKIAPALKADVEEALLIASAGDSAVAQVLFQSTKSDTVRTAAFLALMKSGSGSAKTAAIEVALKSDHAELRHAALKYGLETLPSHRLGTARPEP